MIVKLKLQISAYNQPIYQNNNALKFNEQIERNLKYNNSSRLPNLQLTTPIVKIKKKSYFINMSKF